MPQFPLGQTHSPSVLILAICWYSIDQPASHPCLYSERACHVSRYCAILRAGSDWVQQRETFMLGNRYQRNQIDSSYSVSFWSWDLGITPENTPEYFHHDFFSCFFKDTINHFSTKSSYFSIEFVRISSKIFIWDIFKNLSNKFSIYASTDFLRFASEIAPMIC